MPDPGSESCRAAFDYLARRQRADGRWIDYRLPIGPSDEWVTALVGFACADAARRLDAAASDVAFSAAQRAAQWLTADRAYDCGWGFNRTTGPDADSTAWALRLHAALGLRARAEDAAFLRGHWIDGCGFATYRREDAWGDAHPDVTPIAVLALTDAERDRMRTAVLAATARARSVDGTWPSYWWRTAHYATAGNTELLFELDAAAALRQPIAIHPLFAPFDVACALLTACFAGSDASLRSRLAAALTEMQHDDGGWSGSENLRVTDPNCHRPWRHPAGRLYPDGDGLVTTAVSVRALACHAALADR